LALAESLKQSYEAENRGLEIVNVSSKLQLRTKAIYAEYVRNLIAVKPRKLSQAALETLAVIAYQQPVVKSEVDKIRGVDVAPTIKTLLERKLVKILGYQASVGQPALYGTTEDFLSIFGLTSLSELPSLRDLKALVKEPGEALEVSSEDAEGLKRTTLRIPTLQHRLMK
jgi:segregation and condensation protein B